MKTGFAILLERCGLGRGEAADFLLASPDDVDAWAAGAALAPSAVVALRGLYRTIVHAGRELGEALRISLEQQSGRHVAIGIAQNDGEARTHGFPCVGAHAAAV